MIKDKTARAVFAQLDWGDIELEPHSKVIQRDINITNLTVEDNLWATNLAKAYKEHAAEWQDDPDKDFWDNAATDDGIESEEIF